MALKVDLIKIPKKTENETHLLDVIPHPSNFFIIISNSRSGHNFVKENIMSWKNEENFFPSNYINLENIHPEDFKERTKNYEFEKYPINLFILHTRDLLNWFASLIHFVSRERYWKSQPDIREKIKKHALAWIAINKEFFDETNYLSNECIRVIYDDFFQSREYRQNICQQISGAEYNENRQNVVTLNGGGSSFDKFDYQDRASEMQVLERYKQVREEYLGVWKILKEYPEAIELYLKHFEVSDEKKEFIDDIK